MKLYITRKKSKKSGKTYLALYREKPDGVNFITFDAIIMCRLSGLEWGIIKEVKLNEKLYI